ncbi:MAG: Opr family porin [Arcobacter sp.]|jgi:hypothetical protein|uniref:Opr family porin n=1 Tax=Arcobacter sp. TaxID=1872629 RepID=UPI002A755438|nr:Opr family porin [Arcobacter sp.]MDY3204083.1 Opr family porin [Arcobacter sp.]
MKNLLKGQTISLVACGLILSSTMAFGADTIDAAFKEGKASGSLALYGAKYDLKDGVTDSGYGNGNATVAFETGSFYGLSAKAEFKGNLKLGEVENNDYDSNFANHSLMTEAYIKYAMEGFAISAGRQAIDLEWLGDYNESVVAAITAVPDTTIVLGFANRQAESGIDVSEDFSDINGNKGAYVADIKYTGLQSVEFNPYAYTAPDVADWYGLKTTFTTDYVGGLVHYTASNEDVVNTDDGSMLALELNTTVADLTAAVGYIKTDKDGGIGSMAVAGDNYVPFDSGNAIYLQDARNVYGSLGYTIVGVELGALYGVTTYGSADYKEKELNLTAGYSITESLGTSILFANIDGDEADATDATTDQNYVLASVEYTF